MRDARREALSLLTALSVPASALLVIPPALTGFKPSVPAPAALPSAAFVVLTPEQESRALRRTKFAGAGDAPGLAVRHADLILNALPDDPPAPVVRLSDRARPPAPRRLGWRPPPYLPTSAAPPPALIPSEQDETPPCGFAKEDLLKID